MPSMSCAIEVDETPLSAHGWLTAQGERSAWVDVNAHQRRAEDPFLGQLGELSLYGTPAAMRRLAEAILAAVGEAERIRVPSSHPEPADCALVIAD